MQLSELNMAVERDISILVLVRNKVGKKQNFVYPTFICIRAYSPPGSPPKSKGVLGAYSPPNLLGKN